MRHLARFAPLGIMVLVAMLLVLTARFAAAHDVGITSVARVFIDQVGEGRYTLSIVDIGLPPIGDSPGVLPSGCRHLPEDGVRGTVALFRFQCDDELMFDDVITLPWDLAGVVAIAHWSDGTDASAYFRGKGNTVPVQLGDLLAGAGSRFRLSERYFALGTEHILLGIDHLLFVLGLLLLVRGVGPLVKTITAFTIAHSITLAAAVMGVVALDRGPVEAAIALSIVLLAREIVIGYSGHTHLVHRRPWLVAFVFGLLHGLGFAGALGEIGLRSADVPLALLSFNLGVEAGQLAFVALLVLLNRMVGETLRFRVPRFEPAVGYALGGLAMLWLFDRLPAVWGA